MLGYMKRIDGVAVVAVEAGSGSCCYLFDLEAFDWIVVVAGWAG